ncbi:MAG TPA: O-antigen ligase family protein [Candidatus Dormibacteraeota bacterium]|nr:O-antigen ligase family protein [Candidatus Dormibacteraeota bacterium]
MPASIATVVYIFLILALFWLDRNRKASPALWIPGIWLLLSCSRSVSQWTQLGSPLSSSEQYMEGNPLDRAVYSGLLAIGLIVLGARRRQVWRLLRANGPILLFFAYCAFSLLWSDYPDVAFKRWTKAIGDLVMVLIVLTDREPTAAVKHLLARAGFILIPLSVLITKYYPDLGRYYGTWDYKTYFTGVTTNKNALGVICLLYGLASAWRFLAAFHSRTKDRIGHMVAHGVILAMVIWLFWIANSMTSLACFLLASTLLLATHIRIVARRPSAVHFLVAAAVGGCVSVLFLGIGNGVLETMGRNSTLTDRTGIWELVIAMTKNPLVGTGFESFWLGPRLQKIWSIYSWRPAEAHNGYIEIFLNLGWIGIVLLAIVIVSGYRTVIASFRRGLPVGNLFLAYFVVGVVYNFTEAAFFRMMAPAWIFFLMAIMSVPERSTVPLSARDASPVPMNPDLVPAGVSHQFDWELQ